MVDALPQLTNKELKQLRAQNVKGMGGEIPFVSRPYEKQSFGENISILNEGPVGISDKFEYNVQRGRLPAVGTAGLEDNKAVNQPPIKLNIKPPEEKVSEPSTNNRLNFFEYIGQKIKQILGKKPQ